MTIMTSQIKVWGNSNALRLNKEILGSLGLAANDEVEMEIQNNQLIITPKKKATLRERLANFNGAAEPYIYPEDLNGWLDQERVGGEEW